MVKSTLSSKAQQILNRLRTDFEYFAEKFLYITDKEGNLVPLILNPAQKILYHTILEMEAKGHPVRVIILKARQMGISTFIQAFMFWKCITKPNRDHFTIAHDADATDNLFEMSKLYYMRLPDWIKPMKKYSNKRLLRFENPDDKTAYKNPGLRSKIVVQTAQKGGGMGRSFRIHAAHLSETSRWTTGKKAKLALKNSIPKILGTYVFEESTAKGVGGDFHDSYWKAKDGYGKSSYRYKALFLAWTVDPTYRMEFENEEEKQEFIESLTDKEKELMKKHGIDLEQLNWRRDTIENECEGDELNFCQEYPLTDLEAFIAESSSIFDQEALQRQYWTAIEREQKTPGTTGYLKVGEDLSISFVESKYDFLKIYEFPKPKHTYCITADTAKGRDERADFCALSVWDAHTGEQVAVWHPDEQKNQPDLVDFTKISYIIGCYYNLALIAPEAIFDSTMIRGLKDRGYPNIYRQVEYSRGRRNKTDNWGFRTNQRTKEEAIDRVQDDLREYTIVINDVRTIQEMTTFILHENKKMGASQGCKDDMVTTVWIFSYIRGEVTFFKPKDEKPDKERIIDIIRSVRRGALKNVG